MNDTPQERNQKKLRDILSVMDRQAEILEELGKQHHEMANSLRACMLRGGRHSLPQLIAMRQGIRRQAQRYEEAELKLLAALDLALVLEEM